MPGLDPGIHALSACAMPQVTVVAGPNGAGKTNFANKPGRGMERLMDTIINVQEVQAELDRAARDARNGPANVRAGRFVHDAAAKVSGTPPSLSESESKPVGLISEA